RGKDQIALLQSLPELLQNHAAYPLGLQIKGLVVTLAEHVGAGQDTANHLVAKALGPAARHHVVDIAVFLGPVAIPDAVIAGQIAGGLSQANDIIGSGGLVYQW